jgi:uncharacterized DUF497 family protein
VQYDEITIDDANEAHVTRHGVTVAEIHQVFSNGPTVRRNRRTGTADYLATGTTDGGRKITVAFDYAAATRTVRPIAAWSPE